MQKIGIIGRGFVGSAVEFGFSPNTGCDAEVKVYDKDPSKSIHTLKDTVNSSDFLFMSVPTPANKDGSINLDIIYEAVGCDKCNNTGYKGRMAVHELLEVSENVKKLILKGANSEEIKAEAIREGMRTLYEDGLVKIGKGLTSIEEIKRVLIAD